MIGRQFKINDTSETSEHVAAVDEEKSVSEYF